MANEKVQVKVTAAPVLVAWPELFNPRRVKIGGVEKGDPYYSARFVFDPDHPDLKVLKTEASNLLRGVRPSADFKTLRPSKDFGWPFKTGEQVIASAQASAQKKARAAGKTAEEIAKAYKGGEDYAAGKIVLFSKAKDEYPPQLAVYENGRWIDLDSKEMRAANKAKFFGGMLAYGSFSLQGYDISESNWGVTCYLNGVGATGKGTRMSGVTIVAAEHYPTMTGENTAENPLADDEISF